MSTNESIEKAIQLNEKKTELLKELKESLIYEKCTYDVRREPGRNNRFMLFEILTSKEVKYGTDKEIRTWLERRNVPNNKVYNYEMIEYVEPVKVEDTGFRLNGRVTKRLEY